MKELIQQMNDYCRHTTEESKIIHDVLIEFIKKASGEIDTSNEDNSNDPIYAYIYNDFAEACTEFKVDKVRVDGKDVMIYASDYYSEDDNDKWFPILGDYVIANATLYNLCECLPEYVDN